MINFSYDTLLWWLCGNIILASCSCFFHTFTGFGKDSNLRSLVLVWKIDNLKGFEYGPLGYSSYACRLASSFTLYNVCYTGTMPKWKTVWFFLLLCYNIFLHAWLFYRDNMRNSWRWYHRCKNNVCRRLLYGSPVLFLFSGLLWNSPA